MLRRVVMIVLLIFCLLPVSAKTGYEYILVSAEFEERNDNQYLSLHLRRRSTDYQFWISYVCNEFTTTEFDRVVKHIADIFKHPRANRDYIDATVDPYEVARQIDLQFYRISPHLKKGEAL